VNEALVGECWEIGTAVFEVSQPRIPCWRLGVWMNDQPRENLRNLYKLVRESLVDPLKEFTEACREERKAMLKASRAVATHLSTVGRAKEVSQCGLINTKGN
jgi:hypothetical protein